MPWRKPPKRQSRNGCSRVDPEQSTPPDIRPVRDEDVEALVQLTLAAFVPVFRSFEQMLGPEIYRMIWPDWRAGQQKAVETFCRDREHYSVWVAEAGGEPVGFTACVVDPKDRTGEVQFLAVDPAHQNCGVGTALNRFALERMRESGVRLARVETGDDASHAPARRSYEKAGYVPMPLVRYFKNL
jgi:ribosomal protein S18 acetylase RimI-like enzyme